MTVKTSSTRKNGIVRSSAVEASEQIPLRFGDDPYVWACWLYYEDGMTQGDIAETWGCSTFLLRSSSDRSA
jgi:dihydroxyacetone kinase-like protein